MPSSGLHTGKGDLTEMPNPALGGLLMFKPALLLFSILTLFLLGCTGQQGPQGIQGPQGERGDQGIQGERGEQGERGLPGTQGAQGMPGPEGERGEQGVQGRRGEQGEQGIQGIQGERGQQGPPGEPGKGIELPFMFYALDDLNRIAPNLEEELGGSWESYESVGAGQVSQLTTPNGYVRYVHEHNYWTLEAATADPAQHERLIAGFLRAIDPNAAAQRVAERVVANRTASGRGCQGPRMLSLYTYQDDDGEWFTNFWPVLSEGYDINPAC